MDNNLMELFEISRKNNIEFIYNLEKNAENDIIMDLDNRKIEITIGKLDDDKFTDVINECIIMLKEFLNEVSTK
jgi:hypothetical protein